MIQVHKAAERGHFDHGWLDTYHTFSFGDYYDPRNMGFRSLRVINDDRVQYGQGFGMHGQIWLLPERNGLKPGYEELALRSSEAWSVPSEVLLFNLV